MSSRSTKEIRRTLFEDGNAKCPICLEAFTEAEAIEGQTVTLEHVPPKALGGKPMCLTCTKCNVGAGQGVDQAATLLTRSPKATIEILGRLEAVYLTDDLVLPPSSVATRLRAVVQVRKRPGCAPQ